LSFSKPTPVSPLNTPSITFGFNAKTPKPPSKPTSKITNHPPTAKQQPHQTHHYTQTQRQNPPITQTTPTERHQQAKKTSPLQRHQTPSTTHNKKTPKNTPITKPNPKQPPPTQPTPPKLQLSCKTKKPTSHTNQTPQNKLNPNKLLTRPRFLITMLDTPIMINPSALTYFYSMLGRLDE
jgi:hypothetical protein